MATQARFHPVDGAADTSVHLRPAETRAPKPVGQAAGPFDVPAAGDTGPSLRDALMTGLLVIYPALATVAAIVAGLFLAGANAT